MGNTRFGDAEYAATYARATAHRKHARFAGLKKIDLNASYDKLNGAN
jgi:hypothetical protein